MTILYNAEPGHWCLRKGLTMAGLVCWSTCSDFLRVSMGVLSSLYTSWFIQQLMYVLTHSSCILGAGGLYHGSGKITFTTGNTDWQSKNEITYLMDIHYRAVAVWRNQKFLTTPIQKASCAAYIQGQIGFPRSLSSCHLAKLSVSLRWWLFLLCIFPEGHSVSLFHWRVPASSVLG